MLKHLPAFIAKMEKEGLPSIVNDTFRYYYRKIVSGQTGLISDKDIRPVDYEEIENSKNLAPYSEDGRRVLKNTIKIVLNGGLGTSMGLTGPKSLLKAKNGNSFLDIILLQAASANVQMALMNSFSTHPDTMAALAKRKQKPVPFTFLQHKFPKIIKENLRPALWPDNPALEWNPPGHGDVYIALFASGMLQALLNQNIVYAFIKNSDNLGATMDTSLLGYFSKNDFPFMMEVSQRTPADKKGGHLAKTQNGRLLLREIAQCPEDELTAFEDIERYRFFNTNSLWINLKALLGLIESQKTVRLPMILNPKTLDPRDKKSPPVYQIETAMGAAISLFEGATAVKVPGARFFPVKKCDGLMAVRSDCFVFTETHHLILNPKRHFDRPSIELDPRYFGKLDQFEARFACGIPSLVKCETLTIKGDVRFEGNVTIKGKVLIENQANTQAVIKEGTIIDHDLIIG